jgi:FtsP/CotA-like multicopper oxidase with cupredoxin domain
MVKTNYIFHRLPALVAGMQDGESQGLATKFRAIAGKVGFLALVLSAGPIYAQSFRVQCPQQTTLHATGGTTPGQIKCQHIAGSDGYATMADGHQIYLFGFAPLSGQQKLLTGIEGTQTAADFSQTYSGPAGILDFANYPATPPGDAAVVEPAQMMNTGVLFANTPAPQIAIDEDDELFLTLSNVGMIMRPDLFEQHTVHFHGYPQASSFFDGVPDASVAINIAGSFTYYYTAPDAGTYFWHCHITPPEHLQMGMEGQLFVRPRQNRTAPNTAVYNGGVCGTGDGILCNSPAPAAGTPVYTVPATAQKFAYDDGDGTTRYDVEYPIQMMGFDPNFHYVGMTFNPESFADMKDKYFLLSGRSYPDTVGGSGVDAAGNAVPSPMATEGVDSITRPSQPQHTLITINKSAGQTRALLRISNLSVTEYHTLATIGIPMTVIAFHARLLRDLAGNNLYYNTNSITIGGGESLDVILDVSDAAYKSGQTFFLYSTNLDHLSNDAENFGGEMTEIRII